MTTNLALIVARPHPVDSPIGSQYQYRREVGNHEQGAGELRRIALAAIAAAVSLGTFAGPAGADPVATICGSVTVTVNGSPVVDQSQCQVLPPQ